MLDKDDNGKMQDFQCDWFGGLDDCLIAGHRLPIHHLGLKSVSLKLRPSIENGHQEQVPRK